MVMDCSVTRGPPTFGVGDAGGWNGKFGDGGGKAGAGRSSCKVWPASGCCVAQETPLAAIVTTETQLKNQSGLTAKETS